MPEDQPIDANQMPPQEDDSQAVAGQALRPVAVEGGFVEVKPTEFEIFEAVRRLEENSHRPVTSEAVGRVVQLAPRTVRTYLSVLERLNLVQRPNGVRSGWSTRPKPRLRVE